MSLLDTSAEFLQDAWSEAKSHRVYDASAAIDEVAKAVANLGYLVESNFSPEMEPTTQEINQVRAEYGLPTKSMEENSQAVSDAELQDLEDSYAAPVIADDDRSPAVSKPDPVNDEEDLARMERQAEARRIIDEINRNKAAAW